ncbi:MAG: hypothetical protein ACOCZK_01675 [Planctomycetota bacterium]
MPALTGQSRKIRRHTRDCDTRRIRRRLEASLHYYAENPDQIDQRLDELAHEWDIERLLESNASTLILIGSLMSAFGHRRGHVLTGIVSGFLLQHAVQGWCPPLVVLRRLGVRSKDEILEEHYALRVLRGDLDELLSRDYERPEDRIPLLLGLLEANAA